AQPPLDLLDDVLRLLQTGAGLLPVHLDRLDLLAAAQQVDDLRPRRHRPGVGGVARTAGGRGPGRPRVGALERRHPALQVGDRALGGGETRLEGGLVRLPLHPPIVAHGAAAVGGRDRRAAVTAVRPHRPTAPGPSAKSVPRPPRVQGQWCVVTDNARTPQAETGPRSGDPGRRLGRRRRGGGRRPGGPRRDTWTPPSPGLLERRRAAVPAIRYPEELPVSARRDDIAAAIRDHQVVVVAGETGSGKTTQIPKICLELGYGVEGTIGHTQPRRIAARTVAERIAEELQVPLGSAVGYQVRFTDVVSDTTLVKLMTDGILLAEIQRDPLLRHYQVIVVDEAHERSLNIDFILGYLKRLLPQRPDLKVVITSATIDSERFAEHFGSDGAPAPVIEVTGRTYPVEIRYRPLVPDLPDSDTDADPDDLETDVPR